jgi:DMSO/TMAO reductase YedYZ molybdopterin-dependent catalytic subunit
VAAVTLATVGQTVRPLRGVSVLAPRDPAVGPQGVPVNRTAHAAGVIEAATSPDYRLTVGGSVDAPLSLSLDDLRALPQREAVLPIACVDGWSAVATWRGIPVRDLLERAGARSLRAEVVSLQQPGAAFSSSVLEPEHAEDPDTLLALELNGEPLALDHGFPVRLIAPSRPGVLQTKWVTSVMVR